jgi:hypothetical protein
MELLKKIYRGPKFGARQRQFQPAPLSNPTYKTHPHHPSPLLASSLSITPSPPSSLPPLCPSPPPGNEDRHGATVDGGEHDVSPSPPRAPWAEGAGPCMGTQRRHQGSLNSNQTQIQRPRVLFLPAPTLPLWLDLQRRQQSELSATGSTSRRFALHQGGA